MARRTELTVLTRRCDLGEHVLVHVALGVAVLHRDRIQPINRLLQQRRGGDGEPGILHVAGVAAVGCSFLKEREDVVVDDVVHVLGAAEIFEA